ncbi:MAG: aminoacyl-tRNA hydrolase [Elusimicrobia bacterium HGW-Elusimicrobia-1]|jgi:PTH1 family peptidyl-tRNA hydrolase|nr:MAG: aminoacyl-tRNA hydrolase [Elusimicrobia bacterium HGW-Elusimicrobia-1]
MTAAGRIKLLVGLGNPGERYRNTRHNAGFEVADSVAAALDADFREHSKYLLARAADVSVVKPSTFMNLSGEAVASLAAKRGFKPEEILVVCDDFALPLGKVRLRRDGSAGGHNGLKSVIGAVGGGFARLRVGVGPLPDGKDASDFVLERVSPPDSETLKSAVSLAAGVARRLLESNDKSSGTWSVSEPGEEL